MMKPSRSQRRSWITLVAAAYYIAAVQLTGVGVRPTSMTAFFGHALIYAAAVGLVSSLLYLVESKKRAEESEAEALKQS